MSSNAPSTSQGYRICKELVDTNIPDGFILLVGPDNNKYIVPEFVVPALEHGYLAIGQKNKLSADKASGSVSSHCISRLLIPWNGGS